MNENNNPTFEGEENQGVPFGENINEAENQPLPEESFTESTDEPEAAAEFIFEASSEPEAPVDEPEAPVEYPDVLPDELPDELPDLTEVSPLEEESPLFTAEAFNAPEENTDIYSAPAEKAAEAEFNPYAPRAEAKATSDLPPQGNQYRSPANNPVNPSYNRPVNQSYGQPQRQQNPYAYNPYQQPAPKDNKNGKIVLFAIIGVCLFVGIIAIVSSLFGNKGDETHLNTTQSTTSAFGEAVTSTTEASTASNATISTTQNFDQSINSIWVAEKVRPSVVGVIAYLQGELAGEGSGVLMSEDKSQNCTNVITCAHVINEPGCEFVVLLLDGSVYEATVVALDERTDIGVLKINATGLPLAEFGDSSSLKIGEPIYAIGNPGGSEYFGSITNGIVAAIDRSISATYTMTCIQHNAAINPGNSGGALVNTAGQVIGINSSKIAKTDYEGMGFAVPSAIFSSVVDSLIQYGYVPNRPELGIKYASVSDYQLYSIIVSIKGLPRESIIIAEIPEGSALSGTQAQVGDLIIAVNGKDMDSSDVLLDLIDTGSVGDTLTLTLCRVQDRSYETSTFDVTVQLVEDKGSITTTTQAATLPQQDGYYGDFGSFFDEFFGW